MLEFLRACGGLLSFIPLQLPLELMTPKLSVAQAFPRLHTPHLPLGMYYAGSPAVIPHIQNWALFSPKPALGPHSWLHGWLCKSESKDPPGPLLAHDQSIHSISTLTAPATSKENQNSHFHVLLQSPWWRAQLLTALRLWVPLLQSIFHVQPKGHFQRIAPAFLSLLPTSSLSLCSPAPGHSRLKAPMPLGWDLNSFTWWRKVGSALASPTLHFCTLPYRTFMLKPNASLMANFPVHPELSFLRKCEIVHCWICPSSILAPSSAVFTPGSTVANLRTKNYLVLLGTPSPCLQAWRKIAINMYIKP